MQEMEEGDCKMDIHSNNHHDDESTKKKKTTKSLSPYFDCGTGETIKGFLMRPLTLIAEDVKQDDRVEKSQNAQEEEEEKTQQQQQEETNEESPQLKKEEEKEKEEEEEEDELEEDEEEPMAFSDLSNPKRNLWIVTTAALPWRTGTAVNPFLRALYFVRRRLLLYKSWNISNQSDSDDSEQHGSGNDSTSASASSSTSTSTSTSTSPRKENQQEVVGKVTLVIPWLVDLTHAQKLYGKNVITKSGEEGKQQQLQWIRKYATEQCKMEQEMNHLHVLFYDAAYWPAFGSIFPTVDICSLIPTQEADVAILEEPEHLNWFRVPTRGTAEGDVSRGERSDDVPVLDSDAFCLGGGGGESEYTKILEVEKEEHQDQEEGKVAAEEDRLQEKSKSFQDTASHDEHLEEGGKLSNQAMNELGWAHKFDFVVGIIHTNYTAYMKQYGLGSTIVAAPVINAMSSMVIRAYCHRVIRLSGTIPIYAKWKEVTCNVHGVRGDFLGNLWHDQEGCSVKHRTDDPDGRLDEAKGQEKEESRQDCDCAPIYFIGKLLWAKGFDELLKVQESYRSSHPNKEYFSIDIFGGGPDEIEIKRAFHGRLSPRSRGGDVLTEDHDHNDEEKDEDSQNDDKMGHDDNHNSNHKDVSKDVFSSSTSIRGELIRLVKNNDDAIPEVYTNAKNYINAGFEVVVTADHDYKDTGTTSRDAVVMECRKLVQEGTEAISEGNLKISPKVNPISILSDVSEKSIITGISTSKAVKSLADSALKTGLAMTFTQDESDRLENGGGEIRIQQPSYRFDPPKSIYELRRTPIPARFMGVLDHAALRNMPYKIFLNPSVTEVLCTTTAEALAMGKFVIIPKHVSNEFFFQFKNCLLYESIEECVEKIQWALKNDPSTLTEEEAHIFTWDAATDRMIQASIITKREARERSEKGYDKADSRMAKLHSEGGKKSDLIRKTFFGQANAEDRSKMDKVLP